MKETNIYKIFGKIDLNMLPIPISISLPIIPIPNI